MSSILTFRTFLRNLLPRFPMFFGLCNACKKASIVQPWYGCMLSKYEGMDTCSVNSMAACWVNMYGGMLIKIGLDTCSVKRYGYMLQYVGLDTCSVNRLCSSNIYSDT